MANDKSTFQQAVDLALRGNWPEARRLLQRIVEQKNDDDQVWLWLADSYTADEARLAILQYGLRRHPDSDHLMQALELQLEKMNNAAAAEAARAAQHTDEPEITGSEVEDSPETEVTSAEVGPVENDEEQPPQEIETLQVAETAEEQQAERRWDVDDEIHPESKPEAEPENPPENLTGETRPEEEPSPLTAPETLQTSIPAGSANARPLRQVIITAAVIVLIILLAYVVTRIW